MPDSMIEPIQKFADDQAPKRLGHDQLADVGVENKWAQVGGGFALDVALDPLTYVPGLNILSTIKKGRRAKDVLDLKATNPKENIEKFVQPGAELESLPTKLPTTRQPQAPNIMRPPAELATQTGMPRGNLMPERMDISPPDINPASPAGAEEIAYNILNDPDSLEDMKRLKRSDQGWRASQKRWGRDPDKEEFYRDRIPETNAEFVDRMRAHKLAKAKKVSDGKGNVSAVSVNRVIEDIQSGKLQSSAPIPASVTGMARDVAVKETDRFLTDNLLPRTGSKRIDLDPSKQATLFNRMLAATESVIRNDAELAGRYLTPNGKLRKGTLQPRRELALGS